MLKFPAAFGFNCQSGFTSVKWEKFLLCRQFVEKFRAYGIKFILYLPDSCIAVSKSLVNIGSSI